MKKMIVTGILVILLFSGNAAAIDVYEFDTLQNGSSQNIFDSSETIKFELNVSDDQDYNITIVDGQNAAQVTDQPMTQTSSEFYQIYQYNYTLGSSPSGGDWEAKVNYTTTGEQTLTSTNFHVATDKPRILDVDHRDAVTVGENATVIFNVSDSEANWKNATFNFDEGEEYDANQVAAENNYASYEVTVNVSEEGLNNYDIISWDKNNNRDGYLGYIDGQLNDQDSAGFSVTVGESCTVSLKEFYVPGGGTLFPGELGTFTQEYQNKGSLKANLTVEYLNVTYENDTEWEPGQPIGNSVKLFGSENYALNRTESAVYQRNWANTLTAGWYTGRTEYNYKCQDSDGDLYNQSLDAYRTFEIVNASGGVSNQGNQSTNQTIVANVTEYPGEDTNETVEGDGDAPGQTPEPEPEPEPEPIPQLSMDVEPLSSTYTGRAGEFIPANLSITNEGTETLSQLTIEPQIQNRTGWDVSNAQISSLNIDQTVYREVLIRPSEDTDPGFYVIPVLGSNPQNELDIDYFNIEVVEDETVTLSSQMQIIESPRSLNVVQNTSTPLPILIENRGQTNLTDISGRLQNIGECGEVNIGTIDKIEAGETASLNFTFKATSSSQSCNTTLILSSAEGAYSFSKISFTVTPEEGLIPEKYRVPFIAIAWTALLGLFAVAKRRYEIDSGLLKAPFVLLVAGEALIFIYLLVDYYQLVSASFLPF